jgi:hypothetical protein
MMSYARFGCDGSSVYVFLSDPGGYARFGWLECCGCRLRTDDDRAQVKRDTTAGMLAHLDDHVAAGHTVAPVTIEQLKADADENDAWMAGTDDPVQREGNAP